MRDGRVFDHGKIPRGVATTWTRDMLDPANMLIVDGPTGALIGGPDFASDLVSGFRLIEDASRDDTTAYGALAGPSRRLVRPDGTDLYDEPEAVTDDPHGIRYRTPLTPPSPWTCRGSELHLIIGRSWYRTDLAHLDVVPVPPPGEERFVGDVST